MEYIIYVLAVLGVIFLFIFIWIFKIIIQTKRNIKIKPRSFTNAEDLHQYWETLDKSKGAFLMMSSGNFGGLDLTK